MCFEPIYLRAPAALRPGAEPAALRLALIVLGPGTLASGVLPQPWVALAVRATTLLAHGVAR